MLGRGRLMPAVCNYCEIRKGRTRETWPCAAFSSQSVSTEIHCKTGVGVGKAERAETQFRPDTYDSVSATNEPKTHPRPNG